ncbi:MAG TPA: hypothetical protein DDW50_05880, partial [Firmicutes bacterium]|nr:hypothetical protein [Bacillota bacterium]
LPTQKIHFNPGDPLGLQASLTCKQSWLILQASFQTATRPIFIPWLSKTRKAGVDDFFHRSTKRVPFTFVPE